MTEMLKQENLKQTNNEVYEIPRNPSEPGEIIDMLVVDFSKYLADNETGLEYPKFTEEIFDKYVQERMADDLYDKREKLEQNLEKVKKELFG